MRNIVLLAHPSEKIRKQVRQLLEEHLSVLEVGELQLCRRLLEQKQQSLAGVILDFSFLSFGSLAAGKCAYVDTCKGMARGCTLQNGSKLWEKADVDGTAGQGFLRTDPLFSADVPVMVLVNGEEPGWENDAIRWGADQTIRLPICMDAASLRIRNTIAIFSQKRDLSRMVDEQKAALTNSGNILVDALSAIIESRSLESGQHVQRMRALTRVLLEEVERCCPEYGLDAGVISRISGAAVLHDIGKIAIPDQILKKPGRLTKEEFDVMKTHTTEGSELVSHLGGMGNEDYLRYAYNICRYHHERWDGRGYPDGLAGDDIPLCAQVVGIADAYDALTTKRVYKDAYAVEEATSMILNGECGVFSPKLLECFKHVQAEFAYLARAYADGIREVSERIREPLQPPVAKVTNALQEIMAKYDILLHHMNVLVMEIDMDNNRIHNLHSPSSSFRYLQDAKTPDHALSLLAENSVHPEDRGMLKDVLHSYIEIFLASGLKKSERRYRMQDDEGVYRYYNVTCYRIEENSRKVLGIWEEMPEQDESRERDYLTGLLNRESAQRFVEEHLAAGRENEVSALAIVDLDNFKNVNDTYGHLCGDEVLSQIAQNLSRLFRTTDVVARIGGDEFLVYMQNIPAENVVMERCRQLIAGIHQLFDGRMREVGLSCSVGIAYTPLHGKTYEDLFRHADIALYQAKHLGKDQCVSYDPMLKMPIFPSAVSQRIDSDEQPQWTEDNLPYYAFDVLYESGNVEATIDHLLSVVGRQTNVSRVYIFENNEDNTACSNTFEWCNEGVSAEIESLQNVSYQTDIPEYHRNFNEQGIFYCTDVRKLPLNLREILEPQGIRSMLQCAIRDGGRFRGYVGFDDNNRTRLWTKEQIEALTFLARIVSIFLIKHRTQEETRKMMEDLRHVLNHQYAWVYIVEPETYRIRFFNKRTEHLVPGITGDEACYKVLMNRDSPCENCPIRCGQTAHIHNAYLQKDVNATASSIHWEGRPQWLITCREQEK